MRQAAPTVSSQVRPKSTTHSPTEDKVIRRTRRNLPPGFAHAFGRRVENEHGAAAVELAIVLPILVTLVLGTIEGARMYQAWETLTHAAREAARPLALSSGDPVTTARSNVPGLVAANVGVVRTPASGNCAVGSNVSIVLTYPLQYSIPFVSSGTKTITGRATMRCGG